MIIPILIYLLVIALLILFSAFFSGCEIGFYRLNRIRLRFRAEHNWPGAADLMDLYKKPQSTITCILVGNNVTHYLITICVAEILVQAGLRRSTDLFSSLLVPPVLLIFAEIMPKSIFYSSADTIMYHAAPLLRLCRRLMSPLLVSMDALWHLIRNAFGNAPVNERDIFSIEKLRSFLSEGAEEGLLSDYQKKMADNVLHVKSLDIRRIMIPLDEVVMIDSDSSIEDLKEIMNQHRYSRIPVYAGTRSNIIGVVNIIDLASKPTPPDSFVSLLRKPLYLAYNISVAEALYELQRSHKQLAVITDGSRNAIGIVTIKDLVEEIVGELEEW